MPEGDRGGGEEDDNIRGRNLSVCCVNTDCCKFHLILGGDARPLPTYFACSTLTGGVWKLGALRPYLC